MPGQSRHPFASSPQRRLCRRHASALLPAFCVLGGLTAAALLAPQGPCRAQDDVPDSAPVQTSFELALDARSPLAADYDYQRSGTLHTGLFRIRTEMRDGFSAEALGSRKYGHFRWQQATLEKDWGQHRAQAGIIRLPFGIYDYRETYGSGLIDYPMPRVDYALISVDWGAPGMQWTGTFSPEFQIEAALFDGPAAGVWNNRNGVNGSVVRLQTYRGDYIFGASRWDGSQTIDREDRQRGPTRLNGIDVRITKPQLLVRGEFLWGTAGGERDMNGWYVDAHYRLPGIEKVSLVSRLETLRPSDHDPRARQITIGARYVASPEWTFALNWRRNDLDRAYGGSWTPASGPRGDVLIQVYHSLRR